MTPEQRERYANLRDAALAAWAAAGGCKSCGGRGVVSVNFSDTLDYSDFVTGPCSKCTDESRQVGPVHDYPAMVAARAYEAACDPQVGRWARSTTTRGDRLGVEGPIVYSNESSVKVLRVSGPRRGESVSLFRFEVVPEREVEASLVVFADKPQKLYRLLCDKLDTESPEPVLTSLADAIVSGCQTTRDVLDVTPSGDDAELPPIMRDLKLRLAVRHDQLAEQEPTKPARWVFVDGEWRVSGPDLRVGRVLVQNKMGVTKWVELIAIENGHGVPAPKKGRAA
jgi:hypothetical protein